jgi:hypothetical protein
MGRREPYSGNFTDMLSVADTYVLLQRDERVGDILQSKSELYYQTQRSAFAILVSRKFENEQKCILRHIDRAFAILMYLRKFDDKQK